MSQKKAEAARQRIIKRMQKIIAECDQCLRDIAWWNKHRKDCPPLDPEPFRVSGMLARQVLELAEQRQRIPDELFNRLCN